VVASVEEVCEVVSVVVFLQAAPGGGITMEAVGSVAALNMAPIMWSLILVGKFEMITSDMADAASRSADSSGQVKLVLLGALSRVLIVGSWKIVCCTSFRL